MNINYEHLLNESSRQSISPYILIKRELGYRRQNETDKTADKCCETCIHKHEPKFNVEKRIQCELIGISASRHADIDINTICAEYKLGYIREKENHDV